jgi:hypothetical protein
MSFVPEAAFFVVVYGFGRKLDEKLLHAATPRPAILFIHAMYILATKWPPWMKIVNALFT